MQRKSTSIKYVLLVIVSCIFMSFLPISLVAENDDNDEVIGEAPALPMHMSQQDIDSNQVSFERIKLFGRFLMEVDFNKLDGWGDPRRDRSLFGAPRGDGTGAKPLDPGGKLLDFSIMLGPDTTSCAECHHKLNDDRDRNIFIVGGAGGFKQNVISKATGNANSMSMNPDLIDDGTGEVLSDPPAIDRAINYRNTNHVFGSGAKQQLGHEMTADLQAIREGARRLAAARGISVTRSLRTKGVGFGEITAHADGSLDLSEVKGVEPIDLIVRPFGLNGSFDTVRNFTTFSPTDFHNGMPTQEEHGVGTDPDGDGITDEFTFGDMTAIAVFQLTRAIPIERVTRQNRAAVSRGRRVFNELSCAYCHVPQLQLDSTILSIPSRVNPGARLEIDLASGQANAPRIRKDGVVRIYSDLKRHQMGAVLREQREGSSSKPNAPTGETFPSLARGVFITAPLWGVNATGPWAHDGQYTLLSEVITAHGEDNPPAVGDPLRSEAQESRDAFLALPDETRQELIEFLNSLTFDTDKAARDEIKERQRFDRLFRFGTAS